MSKEKPSLGSSLAALVLAIGSIPFAGWVTATLWRWFVVPLGLPPVGVAQALGLTFVLAAIRSPHSTKDDKSALETALITWAKAAAILGAGYVCHRFAA